MQIKLGAIDLRFLSTLFMHGGYVLDFSNRTFASFFRTELDVDIYGPLYELEGSSKANRLRCFWSKADSATIAKSLQALWEYREAVRKEKREIETIPDAEVRLTTLIAKLRGNVVSKRNEVPIETKTKEFGPAVFDKLTKDLLAVSGLPAQRRGYEFEAYLKQLFDCFGLAAREPFRNVGEQIDGSFVLRGEVYLLEAKWTNAQTGVADLRAFNGKVLEKATWARGLFISDSGFTEEGLVAFGRGKPIICMDGLDLCDAFAKQVPLNTVLDAKVRYAAESGAPFRRVRDLFPS